MQMLMQYSYSSLQLSLERLVLQSKALHTAAKTAFQASIGAYSTYPADLKHIFHVKSLHLGHFAKSFALRDAPSDTHSGVQKRKEEGGRASGGDLKRRKTLKQVMNEEFSAGDDLLTKKKKKK